MTTPAPPSTATATTAGIIQGNDNNSAFILGDDNTGALISGDRNHGALIQGYDNNGAVINGNRNRGAFIYGDGDNPPNPDKRGTIDESESTFNPAEKKIAETLADQRLNVKAVRAPGGKRTGDADVNGVRTEFKTIQPTTDATDKTIKKRIEKSAERGGQARVLIIDARGNTGLTKDDAKLGITRAVNGYAKGRYDRIEVWGPTDGGSSGGRRLWFVGG